MPIFEIIQKHGEHEEVVVCYNKNTGLKAFIAVHDTTLGPALGGTRMWSYSSDEDALVDVLRLSKGMTYKAAVAGLNLGGGKAVIIGDPKTHKSEVLFRSFGQYVNSLNGRYITAEDLGTNVQDMEYVYSETPWVAGIPKELGGSGDPSPFTAHGVLHGIRAAVLERLRVDSLKGVRVAIQGVGNVGYYLAQYLHKEGALLKISDIDSAKVKRVCEEFQATAVSHESILETECDVIAPCALGAIINDKTLSKLKTSIIAGGANNQLAESRHGLALKELNILYAPDFVINAGGLINVFVELEGYSEERTRNYSSRIYDNLIKIFRLSREKNIPTHEAAEDIARKRIRETGELRQRHNGRAQRIWGTLKVHNR